ncbi:Uncharacterized protein TCM_028831 [Theobroma cacao]|uniref:Uncharacterized protein n=1 Tax=Theobroma cacao TaxID=3641 RepID=A0A061GIE9_THECC|nr:Uncharacterized protein TCM_028831 [Theobroma cacao]
MNGRKEKMKVGWMRGSMVARGGQRSSREKWEKCKDGDSKVGGLCDGRRGSLVIVVVLSRAIPFPALCCRLPACAAPSAPLGSCSFTFPPSIYYPYAFIFFL